MAAGLSADEARKAVGVPRATLYRWEKQPDPKSRRPHQVRKPRPIALRFKASSRPPPLSDVRRATLRPAVAKGMKG